jgi:hypothetical protein
MLPKTDGGGAGTGVEVSKRVVEMLKWCRVIETGGPWRSIKMGLK